ncbi:MAG: hypothetical protein RIS47_1170 [Bacteroidota bacterium]|jgi:transcriptional regulator with XRE-family HTH domain
MIDIDAILGTQNPQKIAELVSINFKRYRLAQNLTQDELAVRSGVALSTLKRFEQKAEVSFGHLLLLASALNATAAFSELFALPESETMADFLKKNEKPNRQRARK